MDGPGAWLSLSPESVSLFLWAKGLGNAEQHIYPMKTRPVWLQGVMVPTYSRVLISD